MMITDAPADRDDYAPADPVHGFINADPDADVPLALVNLRPRTRLTDVHPAHLIVGDVLHDFPIGPVTLRAPVTLAYRSGRHVGYRLRLAGLATAVVAAERRFIVDRTPRL